MSDDVVLVFNPSDPTRASALADDLRRDEAIDTVAVVERTADGHIRLPDSDGSDTGVATLGGGAIGALVGVLGGPLGMLFGWTAGMLGGAIVDISKADDDDDGLSVLARGLAAGGTVVMAETSDPDFPADGRAAEWNATVVTIPADQVMAEVDSARAAQDAADKAARQQRHETRSADFHARMQHLFHRGSS